MDTKEFGYFDYLKILLKWKKFLIVGTVLASIISVIISLILPKWYRSTAVIMPPVAESIGGVEGLMSKIPLSSFGLDAKDQQTQNCLAILKSRTIISNIIDKYDLINKYKKRNEEETIKAFSDNMIIQVTDEGAIQISVYDKDQDMVADIVNDIVFELDQINKLLMTERARNNRLFIEKGVNNTKEKLNNLENEIKEFQESTFIFDIETQTKAVIETAAQLKAEIILTEVELNVLKKTVAPTNPELLKLQIKLKELEKKYNHINFNSDQANKDLLPVTSGLPEQGMRYMRLLMDLEMQKKIFEFLLPEYEQAKINEVKDTPTIQFLDHGIHPERKTKPRRALIVLGTTMGTFLLLWIFVITKEGYKSYISEHY
jgi:uncharacterized protein involved in exopolysaccharide biosynthesis